MGAFLRRSAEVREVPHGVQHNSSSREERFRHRID